MDVYCMMVGQLSSRIGVINVNYSVVLCMAPEMPRVLVMVGAAMVVVIRSRLVLLEYLLINIV